MSDSTAPSSQSPEPPSSPATPPPVSQAAPQAAASGTGLAPNVAAGLACFFSILGGIIFLVIEKKDQFVRFWAMQSLIVGGASLCFSIALNIASLILFHIPVIGKLIVLVLGLVSLLVSLGVLALWVVMLIKSFSGKEWEIPYVGKIAREQLAKMAASASTPPAPTAPTAS